MKVVGGSAGLERAAAKKFRTGFRDRFGRAHDLVFTLDRTGSGDHDELVAANFRAIYLDARFALAELLADKLVRRGDAHDIFDLRQRFHRLQAGGDVTHTYHADDDALFTFNRVNLVAKVFDDPANLVDLLARRMQLHGNNHVCFLSPYRSRDRPPQRRIFPAHNKKAHSLRVGRISRNSTCLDGGPSLLEAAVGKSPPMGVGREIHGSQCSGSYQKGNPEFLMTGISRENGAVEPLSCFRLLSGPTPRPVRRNSSGSWVATLADSGMS